MKYLGEELEAAWFSKEAGSAGFLQDDRFHYQGLLSGFMAKMQNEVRERTDDWAKWFEGEVEKLGYTYIAGRWGYVLPGVKPPYGAVSAEFRVGFGDADPATALAALTKLVQGKSWAWKIVVMGKAVQLKFDAPLGLR